MKDRTYALGLVALIVGTAAWISIAAIASAPRLAILASFIAFFTGVVWMALCPYCQCPRYT